MYEYEGKYLTLMVCSDCNNKCKHCYVKYKGTFSEEVLQELVPIFGKKYLVMFNGTEPILHPEFFKYFKIGHADYLITNGLELMRRPEVMQELKDNGIINISLSYHFGIHDDISLVKTEDLDKLIHKLKEEGFGIRLMTSICKDNYKNIVDYCKRAHELNVDRIRFTNFIYQGGASNNYGKDILLNQEQIDDVLEQVDEARKLFDKDVLQIDRCGSFGPNKNKKNFECFAVHNNVVLTPDGNVYMCIFDIDKGNEIGKLIDGKIMINDEYKDIGKGYCKVLKRYNGLNRGE